MEGGGKCGAHLMPSTPLLGYTLEKSVAKILPWRAHQRLLDRILVLISSVSNGYKGKVRIWEALNVLKMKGFECGGDLRESDRREKAKRLVHKDVAADSLKEIRRKPVPTDNLKQSAANLCC
ncbi:hypothetical protein L1987_48369 [Smallanthus sonchifolius]|uniref:Uncharacterized protein n=1 Tax=Smallanthus sonchifolius TaxID=185202 RepID=A0ACB9FSE2_9ASTR|nr:hypothetical protein L1987_48369 [Smallanthus sonchifolius]